MSSMSASEPVVAEISVINVTNSDHHHQFPSFRDNSDNYSGERQPVGDEIDETGKSKSTFVI